MLYMAPLLCVNFECLFCWYNCNIGWTQAFPLNRLPLPQSGLKTVFFYLNCWKICHREPCFFMSYYWSMEVIQGSHVDLYGPVFLTSTRSFAFILKAKRYISCLLDSPLAVLQLSSQSSLWGTHVAFIQEEEKKQNRIPFAISILMLLRGKKWCLKHFRMLFKN